MVLISWGAALARGHAGTWPCSPKKSPALQDWPKHWRAQLKKSPGDLSLVTSLVSHLLRYQGLPPPYLLVGPEGRQMKGPERKGTERRSGVAVRGAHRLPRKGWGCRRPTQPPSWAFQQPPSTFSGGWVRLYLPQLLTRKPQASLLRNASGGATWWAGGRRVRAWPQHRTPTPLPVLAALPTTPSRSS